MDMLGAPAEQVAPVEEEDDGRVADGDVRRTTSTQRVVAFAEPRRAVEVHPVVGDLVGQSALRYTRMVIDAAKSAKISSGFLGSIGANNMKRTRLFIQRRGRWTPGTSGRME